VRTLSILILGTIVALAGVLLGVWWAPFVVGVGTGIAARGARSAVPSGALIGLLAWLLPLAGAQVRYGLGPTAGALAEIMGFGHQGSLPLILTLVVGTLLGVTGAWLGAAVRSMVAPNARVDATRNR
jgi:hypothetical protein